MNQIATVGADVPQDLLAATGRYAGPLGWNVDRATPRADAWLESKYAPWAFSILQDWADGAFDHLDAVVFSRGDDNAQRLYYYICELQRRGLVAGPEALIFDVTRIVRESSADRMIASVRQLAARLDVDDAALERGIAEVNGRRGQAGQTLPSPVCLLAGTPPPDRRIHAMIESAGWNAVGDTLAQAWQNPGALVAQGTGDPAAAIGQQLHGELSGPRAFFDRAGGVMVQAQASGAGAVVLWFTEDDEAAVWHVPQQRAALEAAGIPALVLTRCDWRANDGVDAQIAAFLAGVAK